MWVNTLVYYHGTRDSVVELARWAKEDLIPVECSEAKWRAMPESATKGRRCLRCITHGRVPAGRARYTHRHGSLCNWCIRVDHEELRRESGRLVFLQKIEDEEVG